MSNPPSQPTLPGIPTAGPRIWSRRTLRLFLAEVRAFFTLPPKLKVWEWAAKNVFLSSDVSAEPGFYDPDRIPYQKRIQEWATERRVNDIVIVTAAQLIKTTTINNIVAFFVAADPANILVVYPVLDDAKDWMRDKFMPMIRSSKVLRSLIPDSDKRTAGQTTLIKHYPGGWLKATGANSAASLRGRSMRIIIQDDIDAFRDNTEGDPCVQADKRAANQPRALRIKASTPTVKGASKIWAALETSTFDQLLCPCPKCSFHQTLEWEGLVFDPTKPEDARYRCSNCGHLWNDSERFNAVMEGARRDLWRSKNPHARVKGIHMNGLYRLMGEKTSMTGFMEEWVLDYLDAKAKGEKSYQVWLNTFLALCYEPANVTIEADPLYDRRENYNPAEIVPEAVLVVVAAVDVQSNRLEIETRGFGLGMESWALEYREFSGDPTQALVWKKLDAFLAQTYRHPIRGQIRIAQCFVDAGGSKQNEAYIFTERRNGRGIYACRGAKDPNAPVLSALRKAGYNQVPFYFVGTQAVKDTLQSRLLMKEPGPGYFHWPKTDDFGREYFKKLTAEKKVKRIKGAFKGKMMWDLAEGARNEPWDINVYMVGAMEAAGFTEKHLRQISRDNERIRAQLNLPPKPDMKVTNLDALKAPAKLPDPLTMAGLKALTTSGPPAAAPPASDPVPAAPAAAEPAADPNLAHNAPESAPVQPAPKRSPWRIVGKGRSQFGQDFGRW